MSKKELTLKSIREPNTYKANIKLEPMPKCCYECPFFHMPEPEYKDTWYERWDCYLTNIKDNYGVAINRYKDCPLD